MADEPSGADGQHIVARESSFVAAVNSGTVNVNHAPRPLPWQYLLPLTVTVLAVVGAVTWVGLPHGEDTAQPAAEQILKPFSGEAVPAQPGGLPLSVVNSTPLENGMTDPLVLPEKLEMSPAELDEFNDNISPNLDSLRKWRKAHGALPLEDGVATFAVRNNLPEAVSIVGMSAVKQCVAPANGTYIQFPKQGGSVENVQLFVDLDAPNSYVQDSNSRGADYFRAKTVNLGGHEIIAFTLFATTSRSDCSFRLRTYVASSRATVFQDLDDSGTPFRISGSSPGSAEAPRSGYQSVYLPKPYPSRGVMPADPQSATK